MSNLKLGVEVISATDLMPKNGQGSSNPYVELLFDGQKFRTTVKETDLNPVWNERFYFNINDPESVPQLSLEAFVYSHSSAFKTKKFLGKVQILGLSFVHFREAAVIHYPLEKRGIFSRVKGELGLKVYLTDDPLVRPSNPLPAIESFTGNSPPPAAVKNTRDPEPTVIPEREEIKDRHISYSVPKENHHTIPTPVVAYPPPQFATNEMKSGQFNGMTMYAPPSSYRAVDYTVRATNPPIGGQGAGGRVLRSQNTLRTHDLVEEMHYLFIRAVKVRDLPTVDPDDLYIEMKVGNYKGKTKTLEKNKNAEWNEVFAFPEERLQASVVEVLVKDKSEDKDDSVGIVRFNLHDVPHRAPPDSPIAPEWYRLEGKTRVKVQGELMVAIWFGTQADEAFTSAWHPDLAETSDAIDASQHIRSKVYYAPRLWYVRVNIMEAQDIITHDKSRSPTLRVRAQIGNQMRWTRPLQSQSPHLTWNDELMLVAAEPFDDPLEIFIDDIVGHKKNEVVGRAAIHLSSVERRVNHRPVDAYWYGLEKAKDGEELDDKSKKEKERFSTRIKLAICLDGGYHVLDESVLYSTDLRPSARQLWRPSLGVLELGIIGIEGLHPQKTRNGKGAADTYCVVKYGQKWVRTRTIVNDLNPKFNEQYTWEVHDPATVLTLGVFDNNQIGGKGSNGNKDLNIGKVRIRLSTLQAGRRYTHAYPLILLHQSGVKKMGEIQLAVRFSPTSYLHLLGSYSQPLLPTMHYTHPLSMVQLEYLRPQAVNIVAARLGRMEPPLRREVVEYMCDVASHMWSMRKSKANYGRLLAVLSGFVSLAKQFERICAWESRLKTIAAQVIHILFCCFPEFVLPTIFSCLCLLIIKNYWYRPQHPAHMDIRISYAENAPLEELDEEFDTIPTSRDQDSIRLRYDRLRAVAGNMQTILGDIAAQGERLQALISWRDPRATFVFMQFCLVAAVVLYFVPLQVLVGISGVYVMRPPRFRSRMPSQLMNFFRRLPARTDSML